MTRYSEEQIRDAIQKAAEKNTPGPVYAWELSMYKKVIDALPEPQDEWEACAFEDIRKGDRVKRIHTHPNGERAIFEGTATSGTNSVWDGQTVMSLATACDDLPREDQVSVTLFRIPAPVVHPDPMEHHIITCHDRENDYFWNGVTGKYMGLYDPRNLYSREDFINWSPAKVVADNDH